MYFAGSFRSQGILNVHLLLKSKPKTLVDEKASNHFDIWSASTVGPTENSSAIRIFFSFHLNHKPSLDILDCFGIETDVKMLRLWHPVHTRTQSVWMWIMTKVHLFMFVCACVWAVLIFTLMTTESWINHLCVLFTCDKRRQCERSLSRPDALLSWPFPLTPTSLPTLFASFFINLFFIIYLDSKE